MKKIEENKIPYLNISKNTFLVIIVMFAFLVSLQMMGEAFKLFGKDFAHVLINSTSNPFIGLFIGLLATAIIQSSSTTTSMVVVMVAAGDLTLVNAIPMLMGANIGTSVTSTIVSMGHIGNRREFRKAISAATIHDFFNIMVVIVLLPLEMIFGFLSSLATTFADFFTSDKPASEEMFSPLDYIIKPPANFLIDLTGKNASISVLLSLILLLVSIYFLTKILKNLLIGKAQEKMDVLLFEKPLKALFWGTFITAGVQSSSVTTSLIVPLVAANKVSLRKVFPFLIGANIGTTITAVIAALSTDNKHAALSVAFAHVLFNVIGAIIIFPIKFMRNIPITLARQLGQATLKNRMVGFAYISITFFLIPFVLILVSNNKIEIKEYNYKVQNILEKTESYTLIIESEKDDKIERKVYENLKVKENKIPIKEGVVYEVYQNKIIVFLGDEYFILDKKGFCWDAEDLNGKFNICVDKVEKKYLVNEYETELCYIYKKQYYQADTLEAAYTMFYLDSEKKLIVKKDEYNDLNQLIKKEEIVK